MEMLFTSYIWIAVAVAICAVVAIRHLISERGRQNLRLLVVAKFLRSSKDNDRVDSDSELDSEKLDKKP